LWDKQDVSLEGSNVAFHKPGVGFPQFQISVLIITKRCNVHVHRRGGTKTHIYSHRLGQDSLLGYSARKN